MDNIINLEESNKRKNEITEIVELANINGYRKMIRWARITRMKKSSIFRVNFNGTIGTLDGKDMDAIADKITVEFGNNKSKNRIN